MTSSVVRLINLCEKQNVKDYYDDLPLLLPSYPLYFSYLKVDHQKKKFHSYNDQSLFNVKATI